MIPQEKSEAVTRGLREAFGVTMFEDIRLLTRGLSGALVYRIVVGGSPFLLRIITRIDDPTLPHHFTCVKAAAEAGLAPPVWYTSVEDRMAITDFVENIPFPVNEALVRMPAALRTLHALPPFPARANQLNTFCTFLLHKGSALDGFRQRFQAANLLPQSESEHLFAVHAQLAAVYPRHDSDLVSSHNDLFRPDNILFDGHRVWLVDWEAAFLNDRYADLAVVADFVVAHEAEEQIYLQEYFGQPPDEYQLARFVVMRQVVHLFYAMAFLLLGSAGEPVNRSENVPTFRDFHRHLWAGEVNLADHQRKTVYGRVHWNQLLHDRQQPRFNEALKIISDRNALS
jgi:aminoglycoside phosphotransferase